MKKHRRCLPEIFSFIIFFLVICLFSLTTLAGVDQKINLRIVDSPLQEVFRMLAKLAEVNLICDSSVEGTITIDLNDVTFEEALEMITSANNLGYHWMGNTVFVATEDKIEKTFMVTRVETVQLQYREPEVISELLKGIVGEINIAINKENHQLIIKGTEEEINQALEIIRDVDQPVPQVLIEVKIAETSLTDNEDYGRKWGEDESQIEFLKDGEFINGVKVNMPKMIEALKVNKDYKILANPKLMTLDGKTANLLIGDRVPVKLEHIEDGKLVSSIEYIEAGIKLEFTPRITDDEYIVLDVKPQISSLGQKTDTGFHQIKTREAQTTLRLKSGETFAIGGLIKSEEIETLKKVPLLGELPILGLLFNSKSIQEEKTELIIFITPKIIYH